MSKKIPLVIVTGATASGKTSLGIQLAKMFSGEIISCDSMQIYKNLDIGTAKPTKEETEGIPHHMIDVAEATESFSVERYCAAAHEIIKDIYSRGKLPIMVGGTGLYADNTVYATSFDAPQRDEELSRNLLQYALTNGNEALYEILLKEDPEKAKTLHPNDVKRIIRAIETKRLTGKTRSELDKESRPSESPYDFLYIAVDMERSLLYERIEKRVDIMLEQGLLHEVETFILPHLKEMSTALAAIGYREAIWYFKGLCTYQEMVALLKRNTRRYAKRQLTWIRKNPDMNYIDYKALPDKAAELIDNKFKTKGQNK